MYRNAFKTDLKYAITSLLKMANILVFTLILLTVLPCVLRYSEAATRALASPGETPAPCQEWGTAEVWIVPAPEHSLLYDEECHSHIRDLAKEKEALWA